MYLVLSLFWIWPQLKAYGWCCRVALYTLYRELITVFRDWVSNELKSKYSLFQIFPRIFSDTLASTGKLGEVNKHSGVLGIPAMLACAMARKVFTTASANEDEVDGPDAGGAVVAGPATWAWSVVLCAAPAGTSSKVAGGPKPGVAELVVSWVEAETAKDCVLSVLEPLARCWVTASMTCWTMVSMIAVVRGISCTLAGV